MIYLAAFITGLVGSFHCMGMCGPIALALPVQGNSAWQKILGRLLYNGGRILTYSLLGTLLGVFGFGLKLAGFQQMVSIVAGLIMIVMAVFSFGVLEKFFGSPFSWFKGPQIRKLFLSGNNKSLFFIGFINGLLPCGFVYVGLLGSVATQGAWQGALFMCCFGLGTLPMMLAVSLAGQFVSFNLRSRLRKLTPALAVCIGCLFILRGMALGIPYVSPELSSDHKVVKACCRK